MTTIRKIQEVANDIRLTNGNLRQRIIDNTLGRGKELGLRLSHINTTNGNDNDFTFVRSDWAKLEANLDGTNYTLTALHDDGYYTQIANGALRSNDDYVEMLRVITDWAKDEDQMTAEMFVGAVNDRHMPAALHTLAEAVEKRLDADKASAIFRDAIQKLPNC